MWKGCCRYTAIAIATAIADLREVGGDGDGRQGVGGVGGVGGAWHWRSAGGITRISSPCMGTAAWFEEFLLQANVMLVSMLSRLISLC